MSAILRIVLTLTVLTTAVTAAGRQPQRGYRGFIETEMSTGKYYFSDAGELVYDWDVLWGLSTTHGYQIDNSSFIGVGVMALSGFNNGLTPLFVNYRYDGWFGGWTPYGDVRLGVDLDTSRLYFSPTVGYRLNWGRKAALNIGVGLTVTGSIDNVAPDDDDKPQSYFNTRNPYCTKALLTVCLGFDF